MQVKNTDRIVFTNHALKRAIQSGYITSLVELNRQIDFLEQLLRRSKEERQSRNVKSYKLNKYGLDALDNHYFKYADSKHNLIFTCQLTGATWVVITLTNKRSLKKIDLL